MAGQTTRPLLFVISGPSGAGKGTAMAHVSATRPVRRTATYTTRLPRHGEVDGVDYRFINPDAFDSKVHSGDIWEVAQTYGTYHYGSPRELLELLPRVPLMVELEPSGFLRVRTLSARKVIGIFVLPPSIDELAARLERREQGRNYNRRLKVAVEQLAHAWSYDYCVLNDDPERFLEEVLTIVDSELHRAAGASNLIRITEAHAKHPRSDK